MGNLVKPKRAHSALAPSRQVALRTKSTQSPRSPHPEPSTTVTEPRATHNRAINSRVLQEKGRRETRATMRQTSGRVAALTVAVCCLLGLLSGPHQALAQGSSSQSRSSSIADSTGAFPVSINNAFTNTQGFNAGANAVASGRGYNGFGQAGGTARSGSFSNFGATNTFTDTNGFSFNGASINNADAFASSFRPYGGYGGYGGFPYYGGGYGGGYRGGRGWYGR